VAAANAATFYANTFRSGPGPENGPESPTKRPPLFRFFALPSYLYQVFVYAAAKWRLILLHFFGDLSPFIQMAFEIGK